VSMRDHRGCDDGRACRSSPYGAHRRYSGGREGAAPPCRRWVLSPRCRPAAQPS